MRTGASGVCSMGGLTSECNSAELRFWYGDEQLFKDNLKYCIDNNIYAICNLDFHKWDSHYPFDINRLTDMMTIMAECGATKSNSRITVENEPMKYWSREEYCDMVSQVYATVAGRYYVGANNEEFGLGAARDLYPYLFENAEFDYFDIHIQSTMIDPTTGRVNFDTVRHWLSQSKAWCTTYGKKLSCTEANWSKIKTSDGHKDLMQERELAKAYCEDFNIVFIDGKMSKYEWLAYLFNGNQNSTYWSDLRQKMLDERKVFSMYGIEINYVKPGSHNEETRAVQQLMLDEGYDLSPYGADSWYGDVTKEAILKWQADAGLTEDAIVGKNTWQWIFENTDTGMMRFMQMLARTGRYS